MTYVQSLRERIAALEAEIRFTEAAERGEIRTEDVTAFHEHCDWTGVRSHEREKWLDLRREMLTASDIAAVLDMDDEFAPGAKRRRDRLCVYVDKVTERTEPEQIGPKDPRFWGNVDEQPSLTAMAEWHGWRYRAGGFLLRSKKYPLLGATLDGETHRGDSVGWVDYECKTSKITRGWDEDSGDLPMGVLIQVQDQLLVTGAPLGLVFARLQGSRIVEIVVEPSPSFFSVIIEETERFMDLVRRQEPPEPSWRDSATEALNRLYPFASGGAVDLSPAAIAWTKQILQIREDEKKLERRKAHIRNLIRHSIGEASYGMLPEPVEGIACWRWAEERGEGQGRYLREMKKAPPRFQYGGNPAAREGEPLLDALKASVANDAEDIDDETTTPTEPVRFTTRRKRR